MPSGRVSVKKVDVRSFRLTSFSSCMFGIKANLYSENHVYLRKISRLWNYTSVLRRKSDLHRFTRPSGTVTVRHTVPNLRLAQAAACFSRNTGHCEVLICKRFFTRSHRHRFRSGAISAPKPPFSIQTTNPCLSEFRSTQDSLRAFVPGYRSIGPAFGRVPPLWSPISNCARLCNTLLSPACSTFRTKGAYQKSNTIFILLSPPFVLFNNSTSAPLPFLVCGNVLCPGAPSAPL